jgi:hypothetical protein
MSEYYCLKRFRYHLRKEHIEFPISQIALSLHEVQRHVLGIVPDHSPS